MTFLVGELASEIRLEGKERYARDLSDMGGLTGQLATKTKTLTDGMRTGFQAAAAVVTAASVAGTALGVSLFKTGAAYNTLQQTSRAALSTLLGGAEAANAQMDKLDAFARTSPFSKAVFISAQQQLLGFGVEAKKVIPILDAVQNAVAATGGSSQQLSEVTYVLAQIQAAGKITATDLMQLGQRGIDAATIIGSQMGKTGPQIREAITKGTLGASDAIDALTVGLQAKFGGAAENVKKTWEGTKDRIKAGSREIGAALAEPFIAQHGGGRAVEWGNQVADVLQGVRANTKPVVNIILGELQPAFNTITSTLDKANIVVRSWDSSRLQLFLEKAGAYAPGVAALGGAVLGLTSGALKGLPVIGALIPTLGPVAGGLIAVAAASPEVRGAAMDILASFKPLIPVATDLAKIVATGLGLALPIASEGLHLVADVAGVAVDILAQVPAPVLAGVTAFLALRSATGGLAPLLERVVQSAAASTAMDVMAGRTSALSGAMGLAKGAAESLGGSLKAAFISNPVGLILLGISTAAALLTAAFTAQAEEAKAVKDRIQAYRETLDDTTGSVTAATREMVAATLATDDWADRLKDSGVSAGVYADALTGVKGASDKVRQSVVATAKADMLDKTFAKASSVAQRLGLDVNTVIAATLGYRDAQGEVDTAIKAAGGNGLALSIQYGELGERVDDFAGKSQYLVGNLQDQEEALKGAQTEQKNYNDALTATDAAASEAARSNGRLNDALVIARDTSKDATERINALKLALDELKGGTKSQADLTRDLNEQTDRLKDVFAAADENGHKLAGTLVNGAGAIDTSTAAGRALYDETSRLNDQMLDAILAEDKLAKARGEAGVSTEKATAVAAPYIDKLRAIASESGLSQAQVDGLVQTMLSTPSVVAFLVNDDNTIDVKKQELITLAQQIISTPNKNFEVSSDDFPGLMEALRALGIDITTLPEGNVKVKKDDGSFQNVTSALDELSKTRTVWMNVTQRLIGGTPSTGVAPPGIAKPSSANGNLFDRGRVQSFANGGFPTGIYAGVSNGMYKFAEPETGWEAFISGRKGQESRNLAVASEAVQRLGGQVLTPAMLRSVATSAQGGGGSTDNSLHVTMQAVPQAGTPLINQVMAVVRRLEARQARKV